MATAVYKITNRLIDLVHDSYHQVKGKKTRECGELLIAV